mgnify:FL=1|jgi:hypothetical protein
MTDHTDRCGTRGRSRADDIMQFEWFDLPDDTMRFEWFDLPDGRKADTDEGGSDRHAGAGGDTAGIPHAR